MKPPRGQPPLGSLPAAAQTPMLLPRWGRGGASEAPASRKKEELRIIIISFHSNSLLFKRWMFSGEPNKH